MVKMPGGGGGASGKGIDQRREPLLHRHDIRCGRDLRQAALHSYLDYAIDPYRPARGNQLLRANQLGIHDLPTLFLPSR